MFGFGGESVRGVVARGSGIGAVGATDPSSIVDAAGEVGLAYKLLGLKFGGVGGLRVGVGKVQVGSNAGAVSEVGKMGARGTAEAAGELGDFGKVGATGKLGAPGGMVGFGFSAGAFGRVGF